MKYFMQLTPRNQTQQTVHNLILTTDICVLHYEDLRVLMYFVFCTIALYGLRTKIMRKRKPDGVKLGASFCTHHEKQSKSLYKQ